jgi:SNF2 family DNA or RNA helicase
MALSHLLKFIYNNGTDEVIKRGKKIHTIGYVEFLEHDELTSAVIFRVKDDQYATFYKVKVQKYKDPRALLVTCSCPYNLGDICRHEAAALLQLQDLIDKNILGEKTLTYDQKHTVVKMKQIDLKTIRLLASSEIYDEAEKFLRSQKASISKALDERVEATIELSGDKFPVVIQKNEERNFDTSCKCDEKHHPLCLHKTILFVQLLNAFGPNYFDSIRNWDKDKNKLLAAYGYSMDDEGWDKKFEFTYKDGKPFLRVLDPSIKRVNNPNSDVVPVRQPESAPALDEPQNKIILTGGQRLGVVFVEQRKNFPGFVTEVVMGAADESGEGFIGKVEKLELQKFIGTEKLSERDIAALQILRKLHVTEISKYVNRNSPFAGIWENIISQEEDGLPADTESLIIEYLYPKLKKLFSEHKHDTLFFLLPAGKPFNTKNLEPIAVSDSGLTPSVNVRLQKKEVVVGCSGQSRELNIDVNDNEWQSDFVLLHNKCLYLWDDPEEYDALHTIITKRTNTIRLADWEDYLSKTLMPLAKRHRFEFDPALCREVSDLNPETRLVLQEKGDYLLLMPVFNYLGHEVGKGDKDTIVKQEDGKILLIHRNRQEEHRFIHKLESLHSNFIRQEKPFALALKGNDVLRNNWFFLFIDAMKEMDVPVVGFDVLKNFRFNTYKPSTRIRINNGVDWFDASVDIVFGDQQVSIAEIKRALTNKLPFVQLKDGTLGILPEEWLKKYSLLFRVGEGKNDKLRLSKYHLSIIDELYDNRDELEVMIRLEEKYDRLRSFNRIKEVDPPERLASILRPYQVAGYHWLNYLNEVGWGGILADDMGLGKTVQALSFLQAFRENHGNLRALVVCPTTLMFNWENEIKKFTPDLKYLIHHGGDRNREKSTLEEYNVIITTYGTLRSDVKQLVDIEFDYVVLDESQAIKNPQSKVTKAASLLKAKSRLCMSGTPLQNNTFDIYAQMNFLNPGMLGSVEFFRNEFATPIDKFGEQIQKDHLRKLLYPFILRRTKEQVAKDLPEKTETILFCEMEEEQRKIYDAFRNDYRNRILGVISEQGIEKSQLTILQGLMKLRQICDSPAIMNEQERYPNVSIKLDELTREISENIGNHKALVFSQYLGMLGLIREKLDAMDVPYEYFDGGTTAIDREKAIRNFQENDNVRVFLISLKAGGVGLNLTAADYVYLVDPWWNPAVEQQAIDRTHRIGQTKNIFAYRMICKDTIEDKILLLQEKKRSLAKDLISDESSFVKKLTREDVEYLFS